jgi:hypothetical protein
VSSRREISWSSSRKIAAVRSYARACVIALGLFVLTAQAVSAAMYLRIAVDSPIAGVPAKVTVTTLVMTAPLCISDPRASPIPNGTWYTGGDAPSEPSFRLVAYPAGRADASIEIPLTHRAVDSAYWDGTVTFSTAGPWIVRMSEPNWGVAESETERCAGARTDVVVAPATTETRAWPFVAAAALIGVALVVFLRLRRAGRTRSGSRPVGK